MKKFKDFLPEGCYEPQNLSIRDVKRAFSSGEMVIGRVISINELTHNIYVRLGDNVVGILPFSEATIYPLEYSKINPNLTIPLQVISLRCKVICAKIKNINDNQVILSRKDNMLEAFEALKDKEILPFFVTNARYTRVYGDIGCGLQGKIDVQNLCKSRVYSVTEICNNNDCIFVKVLKIDELKRFDLSHKEVFPKYNPDNYSYGDIVVGRVNSEIDDSFAGLYMYIDPQVSGILDYDENSPSLEYGDLVECMVSGASPNGLHLRFIRIIENKN